MPYQKEARPRYQRQPRNVHFRTPRSVPHRCGDLAIAVFAAALAISIVWGLGGMYQIGYETGYGYAMSKAVDQ